MGVLLHMWYKVLLCSSLVKVALFLTVEMYDIEHSARLGIMYTIIDILVHIVHTYKHYDLLAHSLVLSRGFLR